MDIDKAFLQNFCAAEPDKTHQLDVPHVFTATDGRAYSFATDGHRLLIVDGALEGCTPGGPAINIFLMDPVGMEVPTKPLMEFLGSGSGFGKCLVEGCDGGTVTCVCPHCDDRHEYECGCKGKPVRPVNRGWLGHVTFNRALLAGMMEGVTDETVRVYLRDKTEVIHVFASDRHLCVMPMHDDGSFKDAPHFEIEKREKAEAQS